MVRKHMALIIAVMVCCAATATHATDTGEPEAGSPEAARSTVWQFLHVSYDVSADDTAIGTPVIHGRHARVEATIPGKRCVFDLLRNDQINKFGWVIQMPLCEDVKPSAVKLDEGGK